MKLTEDAWEHLALDDLGELFWTVKHGKEIAPGASASLVAEAADAAAVAEENAKKKASPCVSTSTPSCA